MSLEDEIAAETPPPEAGTDRGDSFTPTEPVVPPQTVAHVELSDDELKAIGKGPAADAAAKEKDAAEEAAVVGKADDPADKDKEAEEKPRDDKGKFIPKARFDEVNNRARAKVQQLERQIADLQQRIAPAEGVAPDVKALETELDAKHNEYGQLVADGELDKAKVVMGDISRLNRRIGLAEAAALSSSHAQESRHVDSLADLVQLYKEAYPQFDDANTEFYNQEHVNFVARLQGKFEQTGSSPAEALREAVELAVAKFGLDPEPVPAATPAGKAQERKVTAVDKALKAAAGQPAGLSKVGADSDKIGMNKIDVSSLTYEQHAALPESTRKRLRGDLA